MVRIRADSDRKPGKIRISLRDSIAGFIQWHSPYFDPVPDPVPPAPEVPEEEPDVPEEPMPVPPDELELPGDPLAPEVWSPARRSQPTAVRLSAAITNKILEVLLSDFILVPFLRS